MARGRGFEGHAEDLAGKLRLAAARSKDIATNIDKARESWSFFGSQTTNINSSIADLTTKLEKFKKFAENNVFEQSFGNATLAIKNTEKEIEKLQRRAIGMKIGEKIAKSFDTLGKSVAKVNAAIMAFGFGFLVDGIKRVYELQERWTRAIGEFNMKIGGLSAGLKGAQKAAGAWEGTVRGLTDQFGLGLQMFTEFTTGMSRMVEQGDDFSKFGLELARGFNVGAENAGKLTRSFENIGMSSTDASKTMGQLVDAANDAHVPVNLVAKDVAETNDYLVRFGKQGAKSFVTAAGYARRFGMSMRDLQKSVESFDGLEAATTAAAKFNVAFGTAINGIDTLLEDDPARRMETFRNALLSQGKTFDTMSPKQRRLAADMLKVNETQLSSLLSSKNAGESYQKMLDKQAKKERSDLEAKQLMQKALAKTAQTMFAFGAAWDRITVAIGKAIRPLLETLGLAKSGGKEWKSFGQVMGDIFGTIEHFFNELATNRTWNSFMRDLATDLKRAGSAMKDWILSGDAVKFVGKIVSVTKDLYKWGKSAFETMVEWGQKLMPIVDFIFTHSKQILQVWLAMKGANFVAGSAAKMSGFLNAAGAKGAGGAVSAGGQILGRAAMGAGIGSITGEGASGAIGGSIGSVAGGALGGLLGPVGGMIGTAVGGAVGGWLATEGSKVWDKWKENQLSDEEMLLKVRMKDIAALEAREQRALEDNQRFQESLNQYQDARDKAIDEKFKRQIADMDGNTVAIDAATQAHNQLVQSLNVARSALDDWAQKEMNRKKNEEELALKDADAKADKLELEDAERVVKKKGRLAEESDMARLARAKEKSLNSEEAFAKAQLNVADAERKILRAKFTQARFEEEFAQYNKDPALGNLDFKQRQQLFFKEKLTQGQISEADYKNVFDFYQGNFASGGIVRRPTRAMIGENGPEAVIPLRSIARGKPNMPRKQGGDTAKALVNYAAGKGASSDKSNVVFVAGDVYLDGNKVGSHIVRQALSGR